MISSRGLRYFLAVVSAGSIRGAAEVLNVAASAVSRQVSALEAELGRTLLERGAHGVAPTEAGRVLAAHAQWEADQREKLRTRLRAVPGQQRPLRVTLCCGTGFIGDLLDNGLTSMVGIHPALDFLIRDGGTDEVRTDVLDGTADIGLAYNPRPHAKLAFAARARQPLVALVAPGHPSASRPGPLSLRDFSLGAVALPPPGHGIRSLLDGVCEAAGLRLHARVESPSLELLRRFAVAGMGVTFLPRFAASAELATGRLVALALTERDLVAANAALLVRKDQSDPIVASVAGHLTTRMAAFRKGSRQPGGASA